MTEDKQTTLERPTIKGFPELHWTGKRPCILNQSHTFPAQIKERHGSEVNGWINKIFWGDNLQVMSHLLKEYRGKVDLIYIDPPFDSKADYKKTISLKGKKVQNDSSSFEEKQYGDIWTNDEYLQFMYERLILMRELLSPKGSIFLHCDWRKNHHLRFLLDEIFGPSSFRASISWRTMTSSGYKGKDSLGRSHADILYYSKTTESFIYNPVYLPINEKQLKKYNHKESDGRLYKDSNLGKVTPETIEQLRKENRLYITSNGKFRKKVYLDEVKGVYADDIWTDINTTNSQSSLQTGYPTQKPEELLKRIILLASNPSSIVFDCFMGSGTTQAVSMKLGRRFIGADINLGSIQTTTKRLLGVAKDLNSVQKKLDVEDGEDIKYTGFEVYNVNNYDIFRNPEEARELLLEAYQVQKFDSSSVYDGELDGWMVKILPADDINRIATKADLEGFVANLPYKTFEMRKADSPNAPVERIRFICMGHEPDLAAAFKAKVPNYKIDVEVVDVMRDRKELHFKHDSDAKIVRDGDNLVIEEFYPLNLMQKLSWMEDDVTDWRQLVESVMIDWNYDGAVMEPKVTDIPEKADLVKGVYPIPEDFGVIKIKITDLLSESYEEELRW